MSTNQSETIFENGHKYYNFLIDGVYTLDDINGKKQYEVFIDYTANPDDALNLFQTIDAYYDAYARAKNNIEEGRDECEREKYSRITHFKGIIMKNNELLPDFTSISDSTLLSTRKARHLVFHRVFFDAGKFGKADIDRSSDSALLKSMTQYFSNDSIYDYFDDIRAARKAKGFVGEKEALLGGEKLTGATSYDYSLSSQCKSLFSSLKYSAPYPVNCFKNIQNAFDYDEGYALLSDDDKKILAIVNEFRMKSEDVPIIAENGLIVVSKPSGEDIYVNYIKTFMGRRLYLNYNDFMVAKEQNMSASKLIDVFNNELKRHVVERNAIETAKNKKPENFTQSFWNNLKIKSA